MDSTRWREFLLDWYRDIIRLGETEIVQELPPELVAAGWLGDPGASEAQLVAAEAGVGAKLPPSYRAFLSVTNGCWLVAGYAFPYHFWSTEEVEWFAVRNQEWIDAWLEGYHYMPPVPQAVPDEEYLIYGPEQRWALREEYLQAALEVSERGDHDSIYLLNPHIITAEGEWEAWYFDHEEITRYRSFWEMLQAQHKEFLRVRILTSREQT